MCYHRSVSTMRAFFLVVLGCIGLGSISFVVTIAKSAPSFDRFHPDYATFAAVFDQADRAFNAGQSYVIIDLAPLNRGAWKTACLFAGYTHPIEEMERLGARVDQADRDRLGKARGFRAAPVEETELVIAFTNEAGRAHFVHFQSGMGQQTQHYLECVTKPETRLAVSEKSVLGRRTPIPQ